MRACCLCSQRVLTHCVHTQALPHPHPSSHNLPLVWLITVSTVKLNWPFKKFSSCGNRKKTAYGTAQHTAEKEREGLAHSHCVVSKGLCFVQGTVNSGHNVVDGVLDGLVGQEGKDHAHTAGEEETKLRTYNV